MNRRGYQCQLAREIVARWTIFISFAVPFRLMALTPHAVTAETLTPAIIGSVFDSSPFDGVGDGVGDILRRRATFTHHHAVFEFDLSGIPAGTVRPPRSPGRSPPTMVSTPAHESTTSMCSRVMAMSRSPIRCARRRGRQLLPSFGRQHGVRPQCGDIAANFARWRRHSLWRPYLGRRDPQFPDVIVDEPETPFPTHLHHRSGDSARRLRRRRQRGRGGLHAVEGHLRRDFGRSPGRTGGQRLRSTPATSRSGVTISQRWRSAPPSVPEPGIAVAARDRHLRDRHGLNSSWDAV